MKLQTRSIIAFFLIVPLLFATACPVRKKQKLKDLWGQTFDITNKGATALGANVWIQTGVTLTTEKSAAIDSGLNDLFADAKCHISMMDNLPYSRVMKHSNYIVAILKSTDTDSNGDPAIRIPPGQYRNTEYDKGGYILIAGQMLAVGQPYGNIMAIPDHNANLARMSMIVKYEGEHILLAWEDPDKFEATKTHGAGAGHPLITNVCTSETPAGDGEDFGGGGAGSGYAVGVYQTPHGESLILLTK